MINMNDFAKILFDEQALQKRVAELAEEIDKVYDGEPVILVCILKGSTPFAVDLMKRMKSDVYLDFLAASSYGSGTTSLGKLSMSKDLTVDIKDKHVLLVEDIIDTGFTLSKLKEILGARQPKSIRITTLLDKPDRRKVDVSVDFRGFVIPDEFVVGYGLDYDEKYRNLPFVAILARHVYEK